MCDGILIGRECGEEDSVGEHSSPETLGPY